MLQQTIIDIDLTGLVAKVQELHGQGFRLVQICCTSLPDKLELHYSFDKNFEFTSLRVTMNNTDKPVPSVSGIYWNAFLYENEIHDLFGIKVEGIAVDYQGKFYKTAKATPFNLTNQAGEVKP